MMDERLMNFFKSNLSKLYFLDNYLKKLVLLDQGENYKEPFFRIRDFSRHLNENSIYKNFLADWAKRVLPRVFDYVEFDEDMDISERFKKQFDKYFINEDEIVKEMKQETLTNPDLPDMGMDEGTKNQSTVGDDTLLDEQEQVKIELTEAISPLENPGQQISEENLQHNRLKKLDENCSEDQKKNLGQSQEENDSLIVEEAKNPL